MVLPTPWNRGERQLCFIYLPAAFIVLSVHPSSLFPELFPCSDVSYTVMKGIVTTCKHICLTEGIMAEFLEKFQKRKVDEFPVSSVTNWIHSC